MIVSQDFGAYKYSKKYQSDYTSKTIMSQDFGGNKYNKNIRVTIQVRWLCHKTLKGISAAKISW